AGVARRFHRADGHQVRGREDRGRRLRQREQSPRCALAALGVPVADLLVLGAALDAERLELGAEANHAIRPTLVVLRPSDGREPIPCFTPTRTSWKNGWPMSGCS